MKSSSQTLTLKKALAPLLGMLLSTGAMAVNSFDPGTKLLTLDAVTMGGTIYRSVTVTVESFDQLVVAGGAPGADSFDPATNILKMGNVNYEANTYTNVSVRINGFAVQGVGSDATGYLQNAVPTPTYAAGSDELKAFNFLNDERQRCGFGKLVQNSALDRAAKAHASYADLYLPILDGYVENVGAAGFTGVTSGDRAAAQVYQTTASVSESIGQDGTTFNTDINPGTTLGLSNSAAALTKKAFARAYDGIRLLSEGTEVGFGKVTRDSRLNNFRYVGTVLDIIIGNASYAQGQTPSASTVVRTYPCEGTTQASLHGESGYFRGAPGYTQSGSPIFVVGQPGKVLTIGDVQVVDVIFGSSTPVQAKYTRANDPNGSLLPNDWTGYVITNARGSRPYRVTLNYTSGGVSGATTFTFSGQ
jgi:hypothetical protein